MLPFAILLNSICILSPYHFLANGVEEHRRFLACASFWLKNRLFIYLLRSNSSGVLLKPARYFLLTVVHKLLVEKICRVYLQCN